MAAVHLHPPTRPSPSLALPPSYCLCLGRLQLWSIRDLSPLLHIDVKVHDLGFPLIKKSMRLSIKGWLFVLCQTPLVLRQPSSCCHLGALAARLQTMTRSPSDNFFFLLRLATLFWAAPVRRRQFREGGSGHLEHWSELLNNAEKSLARLLH